MNVTRRQRGAVLPLLFLLFATVLLLKNTDIAANGIKKGLELAAHSLIPSLFPFLVLSSLMIETGAITPLTRLLAKPLRFAFGLTENGTAALLLGWFCGLPVGVVSAAKMRKNGQISKQEFDRLLLFGGTPSTGFLIGAVGTSLFGNAEAGAALFFIALLSCAITGAFLKLLGGDLPPPAEVGAESTSLAPFYTQFTGAVRQGFATALEITGFVAFFSAVAECVRAAARQYAWPPLCSVLLIGLLELTAGVHGAVAVLASEVAFLLCAFFAGFAGLSVCMQLFSIAGAAKPRLLPYLLVRLCQGILATLFAHLYLALRHPMLQKAGQVSLQVGGTFHAPPTLLTCTSVCLLILLCLALPTLRRIRLVRFVRPGK